MELFLTFYLIVSLIAFVAWLLRGFFPAVTLLSSGLLVIAALPFYLIHTIIFKINKENRWGIVFFICCFSLSIYILIAYGR